MTRDLQNICSRTKKNIMQMSWLQTQVKIVKFESKKKMWVEKERTLTSCVVSQCLHLTEMRLQSKVAACWLPNRQIFSSHLLDLSRTWRGSLVQCHMTVYNIIPILVPWRNKRTLGLVATLSSRLQLFRNSEVHPLGTMVQQKGGNCLISYRAGAWHYRIFPDFLKSPVSKWWIVRG